MSETTTRGTGLVRRGRWPLLALLVTVSSLLLSGPATALPAKGKPRPVTTTYQNPLAPDVPGDGTVDSCADPTVIKGQDGETQGGKQVWYLYCTTDPLNDDDVDADGDPVFHRIPTMVSTDLVNWTYVGDAFPLDGGDLPAWIDPTAAFWAPDVVYSSTTDRYYLFVTVTETTAAGGGVRHLPRRRRHRRRDERQPDRPVDVVRPARRRTAPRPRRRRVLVLLDLRPRRARRHRRRRRHPLLRLLLRRDLRAPR